MGKLEYLDALKRSMTGLPPELQARTLAYYEQRFVDALASGRSETDISAELGDPKKIAMSLRASAHLNAFAQKRNPANLLRLLVSALGLAIFNLFMVVPAAVYGALLAAMYACALALYVAGIAVTASGLAGANELVLGGPLRRLVIDDERADAQSSQTRVTIGENGIRVIQQKAAPRPAPAADAAADLARPERSSRVIRRAEAMAGHGLRISTATDAGSRTTQTFFGLGIVLGGIILFLLSLVVTKYTMIGIKRYIQMNFSLLKGN